MGRDNYTISDSIPPDELKTLNHFLYDLDRLRAHPWATEEFRQDLSDVIYNFNTAHDKAHPEQYERIRAKFPINTTAGAERRKDNKMAKFIYDNAAIFSNAFQSPEVSIKVKASLEFALMELAIEQEIAVAIGYDPRNAFLTVFRKYWFSARKPIKRDPRHDSRKCEFLTAAGRLLFLIKCVDFGLTLREFETASKDECDYCAEMLKRIARAGSNLRILNIPRLEAA